MKLKVLSQRLTTSKTSIFFSTHLLSRLKCVRLNSCRSWEGQFESFTYITESFPGTAPMKSFRFCTCAFAVTIPATVLAWLELHREEETKNTYFKRSINLSKFQVGCIFSSVCCKYNMHQYLFDLFCLMAPSKPMKTFNK